MLFIIRDGRIFSNNHPCWLHIPVDNSLLGIDTIYPFCYTVVSEMKRKANSLAHYNSITRSEVLAETRQA